MKNTMLEQVLSDLKPSGAVLQGSNERQSLPGKGGFAALLESTIAPEDGARTPMPAMSGARSAMLSNFPVGSGANGIQVADEHAAVSVLPVEFAGDEALSGLIETKGAVMGLQESEPLVESMNPSDFKGGQEIISFVNSQGKTISKPLTLSQGEPAHIPQGVVGGLVKGAVSDEAVDVADAPVLSASALPPESVEAQALTESDLPEGGVSIPVSSETENELMRPVEVNSAVQRTKVEADSESQSRNTTAPGYAVQSQVRVERQTQTEHPVHPQHPEHPDQSKGLAYGLESSKGKMNDENDTDLDVAKSEDVTGLAPVETDASPEEVLVDTTFSVEVQVDDKLVSDEAQADSVSEEVDDQPVLVASEMEPSEEHVIGMATDGLDKSSASVVKPENGVSNSANGAAANHSQQSMVRNHVSFEQGSQSHNSQQGQQGQGAQHQGQQNSGGQSQQQVAQMAQAFAQNVQAARLQNVERQAPLQFNTEGSPVLDSPDVEASNNLLNLDRRAQLPQGLQSIGLPVTHQRWGQSLGQRVVYMANNQIQQAQITLNPEKLGPVQVKLHIDRDQQVHVVMTAQHGVTREAMEAAMPRLKEMMEQAGIDLGSVDVSDQREFAQDSDGKDGEEQLGNSSNMVGSTEADASVGESDSQTYSTDNLVDYYA